MSVTNGWGQGAVNNTIDWGKGKTTATNNWGKIYDSSASGDTSLGTAAAFSNTKSILLDGVDDEVTFSDLTTSGVFTLSFWIKPTVFNANSGSFVMGSSANSQNFIKLKSETQLLFKIGNSSATFTESSNVLVLNQWQHIMLVRDASNNVLAYRNGAAFGSSVTKTTTLIINTFSEIAGFFTYSGGLEEFAFFTTDQTTNLTAIYNSGVPTSLASYSPLTWFRCGDNDTAPTLTDNGSGGNNGTMTNFSTFSTDVPT